MPLDPSVATYWVKIELGLITAKVPAADQNELQEYLAGMDKARQLKIVETGDKFGAFNSSAPENKTRRNLARAMNLALALSDYYRPQKIAYQLNTAERETILKLASDMGSVRVKKAIDIALTNARAICNKGADTKGAMPIMPVSTEQSITIEPRIVAYPPSPVSQAVDPQRQLAARQRIGGIARAVHQNIVREHKLNMAVEALKEGGAARGERVADFVENKTSILMGSWTTARVEVANVFTTHKEWLNFYFVVMQAAIGDAHENFKLSVKENQQEITDRLNILTQVFGALKHGPFPISVVGKMGESAMGVFKVDEALDPRSNVPLLVGTSSGFIGALKDKLDDKYKELSRVGPNLARIEKLSDWRTGLNIAYAAQLKWLNAILTETCNEHFGDSSTIVGKFEAMRAAAIKERYSDIKGSLNYADTKDALGTGQREQIKLIITEKITQYKKEQIAAMEKIFHLSAANISQSELQKMVEMHLYSQYITLLYVDDKACRALPLSERIVDFFADASTWGILMKTAHHSESEALNRLNWKQSTNNRKALVMFCKWYLRDINPFVMLIGARVNGKIMTPSLVRTMCADEVRKINAAIKHGRTTSRLGSSWDWEKINLYYSLH